MTNRKFTYCSEFIQVVNVFQSVPDESFLPLSILYAGVCFSLLLHAAVHAVCHFRFCGGGDSAPSLLPCPSLQSQQGLWSVSSRQPE